MKRGPYREYAGRQFGLWTATSVHKTVRRPNGARSYFLCMCACGFTKWVETASLTLGRTHGCRACDHRRRAHAKGNMGITH